MKLITLGRLGLEGGELTRQKPLLLLAYLAIEGAKPRRHLAELFFSYTSDPLNSLSRALSHVRKEAPGLIEADQKRAWTSIESDATQFLSHADRSELENCETTYGGAFAEDLDLELSPELEEWVLGTREYLAGRFRDVLLRLGEARLQERQGEQAASYGERAYTLTGAAELEPEHLVRVYQLLVAGNSPRASQVREEAESFGIALPVIERPREDKTTEHNLPLPKSSFVGRAPELLEIATQLAKADCRLLTLHGTGGVGKSRLVLQAAYEAAETEQFKDGITFVPLDSLTSADLIPSSLAEALSLTLSGQDDTLTQVSRFLGNKHSLLILDNFEHMMDGATLPAKLLESCPNLKIIVTSRERLRLEQEWVLTLNGLPVPEDETEGLEQLQSYDALNLFVQRAKRTRLDFFLTNDDLSHALKICQLVDGFPLGIELAAVWVNLLPLSEIAQEIERNVDILAGSSRNVPERQQSIRAVFEHSWKLLTKQEQDVLMKLSVFVGGFRREAAAEVADATLPVLASLVDKSLLRVTATGRYDRHPLLFQFEREKLNNVPDEWTFVNQKHATYYINFVEAKNYTKNNQIEILDAFDKESLNIRQAFFTSLHSSIDIPSTVGITFRVYLERTAKFLEGIEFFNQCLKLVNQTATSKTLKGALLIYKARLCFRMGLYDLTIAAVNEGLSLTTEEELVAEGLHTLGGIFYEKGELVKAKDYFSRVLIIAKRLEDSNRIAAMLNNLAIIEQLQGNYLRARRLYLSAFAIHKRCENDFGSVVSLKNLGELAFEMQSHEVALNELWRSFELAKKVGYKLFMPEILATIANAYFELGERTKAIKVAKQALLLAQDFGDKFVECVSLAILGQCMCLLEEYSEAESYLRDSLTIAYNNQNTTIIPEILLGFANIFQALGDVRTANDLAVLILRQQSLEAKIILRVKALLTSSQSTSLTIQNPNVKFRRGDESLDDAIHWLINIGTAKQVVTPAH